MEDLIGLLMDHEMQMILPKGVPMLKHMQTKKYSCPDNVFSMPGLQDLVNRCKVDLALRPASTDHFLIITQLMLPRDWTNTTPSFNLRETDWELFREKLEPRPRNLPDNLIITNIDQLNMVINDLTQDLQNTIQKVVKWSKPRPDAKRWWNGDLIKMRKELYKTSADSCRNRAIANDPSHSKLKKKSNKYGEAIIKAKKDMTANEIWTANKYIRELVGDGGSPRIPMLKTKNAAGAEISINSNDSKSKTFAKMFFPPLPPVNDDFTDYTYPDPLPDAPNITAKQVKRHVLKTSLYKAHGPDNIQNVILQQCVSLILSRLTTIYQAILKYDLYYDPWREFTMVVLRKPAKPSYLVPKAYRPVVLLSMLAKVLTAIVAECLSNLVKAHHLLLKTHFGGRPG